MTRSESSVWSLTGGSASVFALSVVLNRTPWPVAFVAVALAVPAWAWQGGPVAGAALGGIAWLCVTGFDVHRFGSIGITGTADVVRGIALVLAGVLAASVHATVEALRGHVRADPLWVDFHQSGAELKDTSETPG